MSFHFTAVSKKQKRRKVTEQKGKGKKAKGEKVETKSMTHCTTAMY